MTNVVESADVRVLQVGEGVGFALEPLAEFGLLGQVSGQGFDRDDAVEACVAGLIHLAHATGAEWRDDFVGAEPGAGRQGHVCSEWSDYTEVWALQPNVDVLGTPQERGLCRQL